MAHRASPQLPAAHRPAPPQRQCRPIQLASCRDVTPVGAVNGGSLPSVAIQLTNGIVINCIRICYAFDLFLHQMACAYYCGDSSVFIVCFLSFVDIICHCLCKCYRDGDSANAMHRSALAPHVQRFKESGASFGGCPVASARRLVARGTETVWCGSRHSAAETLWLTQIAAIRGRRRQSPLLSSCADRLDC